MLLNTWTLLLTAESETLKKGLAFVIADDARMQLIIEYYIY